MAIIEPRDRDPPYQNLGRQLSACKCTCFALGDTQLALVNLSPHIRPFVPRHAGRANELESASGYFVTRNDASAKTAPSGRASIGKLGKNSFPKSSTRLVNVLSGTDLTRRRAFRKFV